MCLHALNHCSPRCFYHLSETMCFPKLHAAKLQGRSQRPCAWSNQKASPAGCPGTGSQTSLDPKTWEREPWPMAHWKPVVRDTGKHNSKSLQASSVWLGVSAGSWWNQLNSIKFEYREETAKRALRQLWEGLGPLLWSTQRLLPAGRLLHATRCLGYLRRRPFRAFSREAFKALDIPTNPLSPSSLSSSCSAPPKGQFSSIGASSISVSVVASRSSSSPAVDLGIPFGFLQPLELLACAAGFLKGGKSFPRSQTPRTDLAARICQVGDPFLRWQNGIPARTRENKLSKMLAANRKGIRKHDNARILCLLFLLSTLMDRDSLDWICILSERNLASNPTKYIQQIGLKNIFLCFNQVRFQWTVENCDLLVSLPYYQKQPLRMGSNGFRIMSHSKLNISVMSLYIIRFLVVPSSHIIIPKTQTCLVGQYKPSIYNIIDTICIKYTLTPVLLLRLFGCASHIIHRCVLVLSIPRLKMWGAPYIQYI